MSTENMQNPEETIKNLNPTSEEIADVLERGGPWITFTFISSDEAFGLTRKMSLEEAELFHADLGAEIAQAKNEYNIPQQESE